MAYVDLKDSMETMETLDLEENPAVKDPTEKQVYLDKLDSQVFKVHSDLKERGVLPVQLEMLVMQERLERKDTQARKVLVVTKENLEPLEPQELKAQLDQLVPWDDVDLMDPKDPLEKMALMVCKEVLVPVVHKV
jgi:hypothetical protein